MLVDIGLVVVVAVILLLALIATRPAKFRIARSAQVAAAPGALFPLVNDFHQWSSWSPWEHLDPNLTRQYEGPASGTGAIYKWQGNSKAGEGQMTILDSKPNQLVDIRLQFFKPFAADNRSRFTFTPAAGGTQVTWSMEGTNGFMGKAFGLVMNMDKTIGKSFTDGLAQLERVAQASHS